VLFTSKSQHSANCFSLGFIARQPNSDTNK